MAELGGQGSVSETSYILVTGGAGDIGAAIGRAFARRGASVTLFDAKPADEAEPWVSSVRAEGATEYVSGDIRDAEAVRAVVDAMPRIDVAVCNAGIVQTAPFLDTTLDAWKTQIDVNLTGSFVVAQAAAARMVEAGTQGAIVFTGSWVGAVPWPEIAAYSASKAGIAMLARTMALELASSGIRVNVVSPGIVDAGMAGRVAREDPVYARKAASVMPLGALQTPEDVAEATWFLASKEAGQITGVTLLVDGGASLFNFQDPGES
jgi:NAD(P)-dependent dehydrogenase (short-subunit alcohol dehydrogenase family)